MKEIEIQLPALSKMINDRFKELWNNKDRYLILYGSRGSSKSDFVGTLLVYRMLNDKYFKGISVRLTYESIGESSFKTMVEIIERFGLEKFFKITKSPFKIQCLNGNQMLFRGLDKAEKLKGINNPNLIHWEEDIVATENDWTTISTTLRSNKAEFIQEIFTINPVIEDYESNWFYKMFFSDETELSFRKKLEFEDSTGNIHTQWATVHHSTFHDNRWLTDDFITKIQLLANQSAYLYQVYNLGVWANKSIEGRYHNKFDPAIHVYNKEYNPAKPLHISWDFNRRPYSAVVIFQIYEKTVYCIDEICTYTKDMAASSLEQSCQKILSNPNYLHHSEGIYVYGDPSGRAESADTRPGHNYFNTILDYLKAYKPILRVPNVAPLQKSAGEFINSIFESNYDGINFFIHDKCKELIKDLLYMKMDRNGNIEIQYVQTEDKVKIEKYGHCFIGETLITTINGNKRIDEIEIGELVLTRNGYKKVLTKFDNGYKKVNTYKIGENYITCTPDHKFNINNNWSSIDDAKQNDTFILHNEKGICKEKLSFSKVFVRINTNPEDCVQKRKVYDIEVEDGHEYFANGILVHNCGAATRYFITSYFMDVYNQHKNPLSYTTQIPGKTRSNIVKNKRAW